MATLIPEVRVNKNGVPVTKHVKPEAAHGVKNIPSPVLTTASEQKPMKLLPRQKAIHQGMLDRSTYRPSKALLEALPYKHEGTSNKYSISDEDAYGMFSTMRVNDALHLIHFGHRTKESALEFLNDHGVGSLVQDNSEMMNEALARRIPALKFIEMHGAHGMHGHPQGIFLDAAEAHSSGTLTYWNRPHPVALRVLKGDLSLADIKGVGVSRIQKSNAAHDVLDALQSMKDGSLDCTVDDIRALIDKNNDEVNAADPLKWALRSIQRYGADFLVGVNRLITAHRIAEHFERYGFPTSEIKELITYEGTMRQSGESSSSLTIVKKLKDAGVDPVIAGHLYSGISSVDKIIGAHNDEVPLSVTSGWL